MGSIPVMNIDGWSRIISNDIHSMVGGNEVDVFGQDEQNAGAKG